MYFDDSIKPHIENMLCPTHDIHPVVESDWDGIKVTCCCHDFEKQCLEKIQKLLEENKSPNRGAA